MNICFFSGDITRSGGTERVAVIIANELNKDDQYNVSFVSLTERKKEPFFELDKTIPRYILFEEYVGGVLHIPGHIRRLKRIVKEHQTDVLIDIDGIIDMYSVPVKWLTGVKVISWEHFNYYFHPTPKLRQRVRKFAVRHLDAIVTLSEQDKEYHLKEMKIRCPIQAIYNPVINTGIKNTYKKDSKIIISIGRLTYQKGFDRLTDMADMVLRQHPDWEWHIYGEGEDREMLQKVIDEKKLSGQLKLMGNVNDIDCRYKEAAIFVMTSRFEGLPMTLLEAKYYHLPIVSYDIKTGPGECIIDGVNGYLIEEDDKKMLAERINELIDDNEKRCDFSKHALDDTEKFNLDYILEQWKELLLGI